MVINAKILQFINANIMSSIHIKIETNYIKHILISVTIGFHKYIIH